MRKLHLCDVGHLFRRERERERENFQSDYKMQNYSRYVNRKLKLVTTIEGLSFTTTIQKLSTSSIGNLTMNSLSGRVI